MNFADIIGTAIWAVVGGVIGFVVVHHTLSGARRQYIVRAFAFLGACGIGALVVFALLGMHPTPTRGMLGAVLLGGPALVAAALLSLFRRGNSEAPKQSDGEGGA